MTRARAASALVGHRCPCGGGHHECDRVSKGSQGTKNPLSTVLLSCSPVFRKLPPSLLSHHLSNTCVETVTETPSPRQCEVVQTPFASLHVSEASDWNWLERDRIVELFPNLLQRSLPMFQTSMKKNSITHLMFISHHCGELTRGLGHILNIYLFKILIIYAPGPKFKGD